MTRRAGATPVVPRPELLRPALLRPVLSRAVLLPLLLRAGTATAGAEDASPLRFRDAAAEAGLTARTWCGDEEKPHILESGGTGLALFDYDLDGDLDLYLVNGWRLDRPEVAERGANVLYRNRGDGVFDDVTAAAGVGDDGWGTGVAVGDPDGDGDPDLFVTNFGPDVLYVNRGDGSFESLPEPPGIEGWSAGAVFFDADADGDEDLFVGAYIDCTLEEVMAEKPRLHWEGLSVMMGPFGLDGLGNRFFENLGGLSFRDSTSESGLEDAGEFYTFGVQALDLDGDLDPDLYAANDSNPNYLYANDGAGRFQEVGLWSGAALDGEGNAQAGMGVAAGDLDGDGDAELLVTNFWKDASTLYRNAGEMSFEDVTRAVGLRQPSFLPLSWGATLSDLDLDGDLDLFIANGHIYPQADRAPSAGTTFRQRNLLLALEGGVFVDVSGSSGPGLEIEESSRGLAVGDVDGDGDLDLAVSNMDAPPTLLLNESPRAGAWLLVDSPHAVRLAAEVGQRRLWRHRVAGGSYVSASDPRLHFGLGPAERVDRLIVTRRDGASTAFEDLPADRVVVLPRRR